MDTLIFFISILVGVFVITKLTTYLEDRRRMKEMLIREEREINLMASEILTKPLKFSGRTRSSGENL
jgi:hypothetical protein